MSLGHLGSQLAVPRPNASGKGGNLLTMNEAQAGRVEQVFLQVVLPGAAVLPTQHLLPARHSPHEGQVVTATVVAQQRLHLEGQEDAGVTGQGPAEATSEQEVVKGQKGERRATRRHRV